MMKRFKFPVKSPCCRGADVGINRTFFDYKIYGCMECGATINRPLALQTIRKARRELKEALAWTMTTVRRGLK